MGKNDYDDEDEEYVIIERRSGGAGSFLTGLAIGAVLALLFAPQSGAETRDGIRRGVKRVQKTATDIADDVQERVGDAYESAREQVETRIESARNAIELRKQQVTRAVEAGREAAQQARADLERRIAESKGVQPGSSSIARHESVARPRRAGTSSRSASLADASASPGPVSTAKGCPGATATTWWPRRATPSSFQATSRSRWLRC